jgi:hypothetical protein
MAGIDLLSSPGKPVGGSTSALNLKASFPAGTSRSCRGRKLCGSLSRRQEEQEVMSSNVAVLIKAKARQRVGRRFGIKPGMTLRA